MTRIFPTDSRWQYVQFQTQIILGDPSIEVKEVFSHQNNFKKKYDLFMKIDAAIDVTNYAEQQVNSIKNGNTSKVIFDGGHISVPNKNEKNRKMLLFKLAVNKILPIHRTGIKELAKINEFNQNTDTIYVSENKQELNIFPHKFKVKEKDQAILLYQVTYNIRGVENIPKWTAIDILCQNCSINQAAFYCQNEKQLFCSKCFQEGHRSQKKKAHLKKPLTPYNSTSHCLFHGQHRYSYFCFNCKQLKCEECLSIQQHKMKNHEGMELQELFENLKVKEKDFIEEFKIKLRGMMMQIENNLERFQKQYLIQQKDLENRFAAKLAKIKAQCNQKLSNSIAVHTEIRRKYDQLLWIQSYMRYAEDFLTVSDLLNMKDAFAKFLDEACTREYFEILERNLNYVDT